MYSRFLQLGPRFVEYSSTLHRQFKVELLSFKQFRDRLNISRSTILDPDDMAPYRNLLKIILANYLNDSRDVLVPNSNRVLDYSANLYARSSPLFYATFQTAGYLDSPCSSGFPGIGRRTRKVPLANSDGLHVILKNVSRLSMMISMGTAEWSARRFCIIGIVRIYLFDLLTPIPIPGASSIHSDSFLLSLVEDQRPTVNLRMCLVLFLT